MRSHRISSENIKNINMTLTLHSYEKCLQHLGEDFPMSWNYSSVTKLSKYIVYCASGRCHLKKIVKLKLCNQADRNLISHFKHSNYYQMSLLQDVFNSYFSCPNNIQSIILRSSRLTNSETWLSIIGCISYFIYLFNSTHSFDFTRNL